MATRTFCKSLCKHLQTKQSLFENHCIIYSLNGVLSRKCSSVDKLTHTGQVTPGAFTNVMVYPRNFSPRRWVHSRSFGPTHRKTLHTQKLYAMNQPKHYEDFNNEDLLKKTMQKWESGDKRFVRFENRDKQVNPNFAIDLIAEVPPTSTQSRVVSCDGGGGPLGHPKVYINLDQPGDHTCGYCGLRFHKANHH